MVVRTGTAEEWRQGGPASDMLCITSDPRGPGFLGVCTSSLVAMGNMALISFPRFCTDVRAFWVSIGPARGLSSLWVVGLCPLIAGGTAVVVVLGGKRK